MPNTPSWPAVALALLLAPAASAAPQPSMQLKLDPYDLKLRDYCFPSGLRVSFQEDHTQPIVAVTSVIDRGSDADPVGKEGIAHLVEHLWFRSQRHGLPSTWDLLQEMGASLNAFTSPDVTAYMTVAPRSFLSAILKLEAARLTDPMTGVGADEVNAEREIVRNELREGENELQAGLPYLFAKLYPKGHPYSRMTIGTHETLNAITLDDVVGFVSTNYTAANTTIVVVGDFSLGEAPELMAQSLPAALVADPKDPSAPLTAVACPVRVQGASEEPPPPVDTAISTHEAGVDRPVALIAWSAPGGYRPDEPLMQIAGAALTMAVSTYINPPTVNPFADRNEAWCGLNPQEHSSTVICAIDLARDADPDKVIHKAIDGLYAMWDAENRDWQQMYYEVSKYHSMAEIFSSAERIASLFDGRATTTALHTHFTGNAAYYSQTLNALSRVDASQAAAFASKYLNRQRAVAVVLKPYSESGIQTDSTEGSYRGRPREPSTTAVLDADKIDQALIRKLAVAPDMSAVRSFTLDNGLRVQVLPYGSVPIARAALVFHGGELTEPRPGIDELARQFTVSDTVEAELVSGRSPLRLGGSWDDRDGRDHRVLGVYGSSANLDGLLYLLADRVSSQRAEVNNSSFYVKSARRNLLEQREDPSWWARTISTQRLLPGHALSRAMTEETLGKMAGYETQDLIWYNRSIYQPANATLLVVGRVDPATAEAQVREAFGSWRVEGGGARAPAVQAPPEPPTRQVLVFDKPRSSQSELTLRCQVGPATLENQAAREVLADTLSEMAWVALREASGVTYGAYAHTSEPAAGTALLAMASSVQNDAAGLAAETFLGITDRARKGELDPRLVRLMQVHSARRNILRFQSTDQVLGQLVELDRLGGDPSAVAAWPSRLAEADIPALSALMERCTGHEVVSIVGPADQIGAQLKERGIEAEIFDWEAERDRLWATYDPKGFKREQKRRASEGS